MTSRPRADIKAIMDMEEELTMVMAMGTAMVVITSRNPIHKKTEVGTKYGNDFI